MTPTTLTLQEITVRLLARQPPLVPGNVFDETLTREIEALDASAEMKAGLHLLNDDLVHSHALVQSVQGSPLADYWHAIIHRREGDYSNACYWFGRVGAEPILRRIYGDDPAAPKAFVERCQAVGTGHDAELEQFQRGEIALLLACVQSRAS